MIISHKNKYIFLRCRKTGSSSLALHLASFLGPFDVMIGMVGRAFDHGIIPNYRFYHETLNQRGLRELSSRFTDDIETASDLHLVLDKINIENYESVIGKKPVHPHALDVQDAFPDPWRDYFKFCFVRNPYERVVSDYIWRIESRARKIGFRDFLLRMLNEDFSGNAIDAHYDNWPIYTIGEKVAVDYIGRYEHLHSDFNEVLAKLNLPIPNFLNQEKKIKNYDYRTYYSSTDVELVAKIFRKEIDHFQYQFE